MATSFPPLPAGPCWACRPPALVALARRQLPVRSDFLSFALVRERVCGPGQARDLRRQLLGLGLQLRDLGGDFLGLLVPDRLYQHRRHACRINFAHALSKIKASVVRLSLGAEAAGLLCPLVLAMAANVEAVRPDRAAPRKMKPAKLQGFFPNNKRCR